MNIEETREKRIIGEIMKIDFKTTEMEDREIIQKYLDQHKIVTCELTFANIYLWTRQFPNKYAIIRDTLVFKSYGEKPAYSFPIGNGDIKGAVNDLIEYCEENNTEFRLRLVLPEQFQLAEDLFPGKFNIEYDRDVAEYVYESEKLLTLSGKKLHSKRNHINKFKSTQENWVYEALSKDNMMDCYEMAQEWRDISGCDEDESKTAEICVTLNALKLHEELGLSGGLIRLNGKVIAFSIGEAMSEEMFVVHIEKAFPDIQGAYPMINQQFVEHVGKDYKYINREEDMGEEGLRKAKLSYHPAFLVEKGVITLK